MTLEEVKLSIQNAKFTDTTGNIQYNFVAPNTLRIVAANSFTAIHYSILEKDGTFILEHGNQLGTENFIIGIDNSAGNLRMILTKEFSKKVFIALEEHNYG
jgi:hypothetical protein